MSFYVITGGPGAGKSTLLKALQKRGYLCMEEVARQIIQEQMKVQGEALPWKNLQLFKHEMLVRTIETYNRALESTHTIIFFDRDVLDLVAYDRLTNEKPTNELLRAVKALHYHNKVFIAPPWEDIFCMDSERKQTFEEAVAVYENLVAVYTEYGRELIEIPKASVEERAEFILSALN